MKNKNDIGLFDEELRLAKLTQQKDPLVKLKELINWNQFLPILEQIVVKQAKNKGGRPPFNYLTMFKIIILQRYYNLSDDQTEYQLLDRLSFMRFLDLGLGDKVPDSKTIWCFREKLTKADAIEKLFHTFPDSLQQIGLFIQEGKIVDASFVEIPRQRNTREENKQIKEGQVPKEWQEKPPKLAQKDVDARWTKKNQASYYGYKDHILVDAGSKLIEKYVVTAASVHDSQVLGELVEVEIKQQELYGDSAYTGPKIEEIVTHCQAINQLHEKGYKNKPLTEAQQASNRHKSKTRARVEHVVGFIENSMHGSFIQSIGISRAKAVIGLMNLTYNICRAVQLVKFKGICVPI
jgi:IS5 family transposase